MNEVCFKQIKNTIQVARYPLNNVRLEKSAAFEATLFVITLSL